MSNPGPETRSRARSRLNSASGMEKVKSVTGVDDLGLEDNTATELFGSTPRKNVFGRVVIFIIVLEAANMFAFYGGLKDWMNWYVGAYLGIASTDAQTLYMAFQSYTYLVPLLSGIVADSFLGAQKTLYGAAIIYIIGLIILLISTIINQKLVTAGGTQEVAEPAGVALYFVGSFVAAFGAGAIKPAVIVMGADQYNENLPEERLQRDSFYTLFYVTVQVGSLVAGYFPMLVEKVDHGPTYTIAITTFLLMVASGILFAFRKRFVNRPCKGSETARVAAVLGSAVARTCCPCGVKDTTLDRSHSLQESQMKRQAPKKKAFLDAASRLYGGPFDHDTVIKTKQIIRMLPLWSTQIIVFLIYGQGATYWVAEGWQMDDTKLNSNTLNSVFDPLFCMIFMLAIRYFVSHPQSFIGKFLHKRGWQLTGLRQMGIGIIPFTFAVLSAGLLEAKRRNSPVLLNAEGKIVTSQYGAPKHEMSVFWMLIPTALASLGESFCFVGAADFFYSEAPIGLKTISIALNLLSTAVANWIGIAFSQGFESWVPNNLDEPQSKLSEYNYIIAGLSAINFLWFLAAAWLYNRQNPYAKKDEDDDDTINKASLSSFSPNQAASSFVRN